MFAKGIFFSRRNSSFQVAYFAVCTEFRTLMIIVSVCFLPIFSITVAELKMFHTFAKETAAILAQEQRAKDAKSFRRLPSHMKKHTYSQWDRYAFLCLNMCRMSRWMTNTDSLPTSFGTLAGKDLFTFLQKEH